MKFGYTGLLACLFWVGCCFGGDALMITQKSSGKTITVKPLGLVEEEFNFEIQGKEYAVKVEDLDAASQKLVTEWQEKRVAEASETTAALNEALGVSLFSAGKSLWKEKVDVVAERLEWPKESECDYSSSYRLYPLPGYGVANAHPYCCTLIGDAKVRPQSLSLVFANKGDYGSTAGFGRDHFEQKGDLPEPSSLNEAIARDAKAIRAELTAVLGEPVEQQYGEKENRRDVLRWDFEDTAFVLSEREGEYTHLLIVPGKVADNEGREEFIRDQQFRKYLERNILREENGDVRLKNIPMVDQGPKGYCAPATFERAMRYMGVPADMYLLATLATAQGGGTNTVLLSEEADRIITSKARRIRDLELEKDLDMRLVQRYIDKGVPVLWQMASLDEYNDLADRRTNERENVEDFSSWAKEVADEAAGLVETLTNDSKYHICMIVGYNEKTNELAVSDSWGAFAELRWVHIDIAKAVTIDGGFVIDL